MSSSNSSFLTYGLIAGAAYLFRAQLATLLQNLTSTAAAPAIDPGANDGGYSTSFLWTPPVTAAQTAANTAAAAGATPAQQATAAQAAATTATGYSIQKGQLIGPNATPVYVPAVYTPPPPPPAGGDPIYTYNGQSNLTAAQVYNAQLATLAANAAATPAPPGFNIGQYGGLVKTS